jgi:hypothetical protein
MLLESEMIDEKRARQGSATVLVLADEAAMHALIRKVLTAATAAARDLERRARQRSRAPGPAGPPLGGGHPATRPGWQRTEGAIR